MAAAADAAFGGLPWQRPLGSGGTALWVNRCGLGANEAKANTDSNMSKKGEYLRALVTERLTAAAEEIFALFERTIVEYEEELFRSKEENQRKQQLLDSVLSPQVELQKQDGQPQTLLTCLDQEETESPQITDNSQSADTKEEFQWTPVKMESEDHTDHSEDWEAPCSSSAPHGNPKREDDQDDVLLEPSGGDAAQGNSDVPHLHQCCFCDETFQRPQELKKHMEIHALEIHMENLNRTKQSGDVLKQSCPTYLPTKTLPPKPRLGPAHGPPFSCPFCKRCFARKFDLRSHILIHTGEKPFACSQCNMRFNRKSNLYRHFRNHAKKT